MSISSRGRYDRQSYQTDPGQIQDIINRLNRVVRIGVVKQVDPKNGVVRVQIGKILTNWLKWHAGRAGGDRDWNPPSVGEQVTVLSPSGRTEMGVVLTGLFTKGHDSPSDDPNVRHYIYKDGTQEYHNVQKKQRQLKIPKSGAIRNDVGSDTTHSHTDGAHVFRSGSKVIVVIDRDQINLHVGGSGITIKDGEIRIETGVLFLPPNVTTGSAVHARPSDPTPGDIIKGKSGGNKSDPYTQGNGNFGGMSV